MLSLTRKEKETVWLDFNGARVEVIVKEIRGRAVQLIFDAPKEVRIMRGELEDGIATQQHRQKPFGNVVAQSLAQYLAETKRDHTAASADKV